MSVASGGPATQAKETIARVFITSAALAPECLSSAYRSVLPTPAGPPSTTRAITATGSDVVIDRTPARATVSTPQISSGRR